MTNDKKIAVLQRLLDQAVEIRVPDSDDPTFKTWKNTVERTLIRVFGEKSPELSQFKELRFFYHALMMSLGSDYSREHRQCFQRDFDILIASIKNYIEELEQDCIPDDNADSISEEPTTSGIRRVFISHSSSDVEIVEELIDILEMIGLPHDRIFCTSFAGYGINLGENFLDAIRDELTSETLVLFVLTQNFYASPVCLGEMGATWVLAKEHIPIVVPPLQFSDVKGVIPLTQGFLINDPMKLNLFKDKIESTMGLPCTLSQSSWERKRDRIVNRINKQLTNSSDV